MMVDLETSGVFGTYLFIGLPQDDDMWALVRYLKAPGGGVWLQLTNRRGTGLMF